MMKNLKLIRKKTSNQGTFGELYYNNRFFCYTGELPWKENRSRVSCIPEGEYKVCFWNSRKFPRTYHIIGVPNREAILIHIGNLCGDKKKGYITHVLGCIIVGIRRGTIRKQEAILLSCVAMNKLRDLIGKKSFVLKIEGGGYYV